MSVWGFARERKDRWRSDRKVEVQLDQEEGAEGAGKGKSQVTGTEGARFQ